MYKEQKKQVKRNKFLQIFGVTPVKNKEWFTFFLIAFAIISLAFVILYDFIKIKNMHTNVVLFIIGLIIVITGIVIRIVSEITLGKYFSLHVEISPDHKIIKKGFYKTIRHPMYTGALLIGFGVSILFSSGWGFLCFLLVFLPIFLYRIQVEEKQLISRFGETYLEYKRKTFLLIPYIW